MIEKTLKVKVNFNSCQTGREVTREVTITKSDINDVDWHGGDSGNSFFDNEFETDAQRFEQRVEDCAHEKIWDEDDDGNPIDPELNGDHPDGLDYNDRISFEYDLGENSIEDFFPD
jgi:hypothetical protein